MKKFTNRVLAAGFIIVLPFAVVAMAVVKACKEFVGTIKNYRYSYDLNAAWMAIKTGDFNAYKAQQMEDYKKRLFKNVKNS